MTVESVASSLEERGIIWQGVGFAIIGAISLLLLWVYSETDHWSIGIYRLAVTQLSWAFVVAIAVIIEGLREMFKTNTEIRRAARQKMLAKAEEKWRNDRTKRTRTALEKRGVKNPEAFLEEVFGSENGRER